MLFSTAAVLFEQSKHAGPAPWTKAGAWEEPAVSEVQESLILRTREGLRKLRAVATASGEVGSSCDLCDSCETPAERRAIKARSTLPAVCCRRDCTPFPS